MEFMRAFAIAMLLLIAPSSVLACTGGVCPPIEVVGKAIGGGNIICRGEACASVLESLQVRTFFDNWDYEMLMPDDFSAIPVDRAEMCRLLRESKPTGCGSTAPPAPGVNTTASVFAAQHANGCGDGSWKASIASQLGSLVLPIYSGNPDMPWSGNPLSFASACNNHDACYAGAGAKATCDSEFSSRLSGTCTNEFAPGGQNSEICLGFADAFTGAVRVAGQAAYSAALAQHGCALWHSNMEANQCSK